MEMAPPNIRGSFAVIWAVISLSRVESDTKVLDLINSRDQMFSCQFGVNFYFTSFVKPVAEAIGSSKDAC